MSGIGWFLVGSITLGGLLTGGGLLAQARTAARDATTAFSNARGRQRR